MVGQAQDRVSHGTLQWLPPRQSVWLPFFSLVALCVVPVPPTPRARSPAGAVFPAASALSHSTPPYWQWPGDVEALVVDLTHRVCVLAAFLRMRHLSLFVSASSLKYSISILPPPIRPIFCHQVPAIPRNFASARECAFCSVMTSFHASLADTSLIRATQP